jgi:hypothetical protein
MAKNKNLMLLIALGSALSLACGAAEASKLTIHNLDSKGRDLDIQIENGKGVAIVKSYQSMNFQLKKDESKEIDVSTDIVEGPIFSIKGSVTMPSMDNRCTNLDIHKDYNIVFTTNNTGITCKASPA